MSRGEERTNAEATVRRYQLSRNPNVLAIGTFDDRVTVLSQQRRALNLAWALIESKQVPTEPDDNPVRVAVVGAGFAGLTFAAALLQKQCRCDITIFEERDTLLPLQQGSDTRWLHPHIYDWPAEGSEPAAAMLPVLNWTAARASDVVVRVLSGWEEIAKDTRYGSLSIWCNTRHLQLRSSGNGDAQLEWVGESRDPVTGRSHGSEAGALGKSDTFDLVILAVGFGLELRNLVSYWRNERLGQPNLGQQRTSYMVSGQGDGAMIDLLRLKISQFRQDRILSELFNGKDALLAELRSLRVKFLKARARFSLFNDFELLLERKDDVGNQIDEALKALNNRLRRDTEIVLQLKPKVRSVADLLQAGTCRTSFQNALLVYLLYRCGGFAPDSGDASEVAARYGIPATNIVWRHGTDRLGLLHRLLPDKVYDPIKEQWIKDKCKKFYQSAEIKWTGGYFGTPGREENFKSLPDVERAIWRKEYLPGPTELLASSIAGAVAGRIGALQPKARHFRTTLHRVIRIHDEDLLQQACGYAGRGVSETESLTAGRTFPARVATIGLAYQTRRIVRSKRGIDPTHLDKAMRVLQLNQGSRKMADNVHFVAAIPVLQSDSAFFGPSPVCAVLYFDSRHKGFDLADAALAELSVLVKESLESVMRGTSKPLDRLDNTPLCPISRRAFPPRRMRAGVANALYFPNVEPPRLSCPLLLNYDHSDLTPIVC